jgi:hypothetical protein
MKLGASAHKEKISEKDDAYLRYREMLLISNKMDKEDAKSCAILFIEKEIEIWKSIKGLEYALKVSYLKKVKKELETLITN